MFGSFNAAKLLNLLGISSMILAGAQAVAAKSSTTTKALPCTTTVTAKFDNLPTSSSVPSNYPLTGTTWPSWTVAAAAPLNFNATSPPNVIQCPSGTTCTLSYTSGPYTAIFLDSFSFGCYFDFLQASMNSATDCEVLVIGAQYITDDDSYVTAAGPFKFSAASSESGTVRAALAKVKRAQLSGIVGENVVSFVQTSGLSSARIVLDNVVFAAEMEDC